MLGKERWWIVLTMFPCAPASLAVSARRGACNTAAAEPACRCSSTDKPVPELEDPTCLDGGGKQDKEPHGGKHFCYSKLYSHMMLLTQHVAAVNTVAKHAWCKST